MFETLKQQLTDNSEITLPVADDDVATLDSATAVPNSATITIEELDITLSEEQYDNLMTVIAAQTEVQLFQLAFSALIFGGILAMLLVKLWRA